MQDRGLSIQDILRKQHSDLMATVDDIGMINIELNGNKILNCTRIEAVYVYLALYNILGKDICKTIQKVKPQVNKV